MPLASNQVRYGLLHRAPEVDGVLDACRELGVTLLAYSPLAQGILTGKYAPGRAPAGPRAGHPEFADAELAEAAPVVGLLGEIGAAHGGARPEQVALAWLLAKGRRAHRRGEDGGGGADQRGRDGHRAGGRRGRRAGSGVGEVAEGG